MEPHGRRRRALPRVAVTLVREVATDGVGLVGMSLGVKWPVLVTREGDARVSVKIWYWDYFLGGRDWSLGTCLSTRGECIDVLKRHAGYTAPCLARMTAGDISTAIPSAGAHSYLPYVRGYSPPLTRGVCPSWVHWPRRK